MDIFHFFHFTLTKMFGEDSVRGTGSRHPSFQKKFCHRKSDLDLVILTPKTLDKIKEWVENQSYDESAFSMEKNKIFWKDQHVVDLILVDSNKQFPRKFIRCEHGLPWVTPKCLLANYKYQYESDDPVYNPMKKHAEKIKFLEELCGCRTINSNINLTSNSPLTGNRQKRGLDFGSNSQQSGNKRKSPQSSGKSSQTVSKRHKLPVKKLFN